MSDYYNGNRATATEPPQSITKTIVRVRGHSVFVAGKPAAFTDEENRAMRNVLRSLKERNKWTQEEVGRRLGLTQQAAGTILNKNGNFGRKSALALAQMCGFDGPESMLRDLGVTTKPAAQGAWVDREIAAGYARRLNCDELAIERVIARYGESQYMSRDAKWWVERFIHEDRELADERRDAPPSKTIVPSPAVPPAPASSAPATKRAPKARKVG